MALETGTVIIGTQWGDEGKGKLVDAICKEYDICVRFNGGDNAGHSVHVNDQEFAFHLLPSGIIHPNCICVIGNGCVVNLESLDREIKGIVDKGLNIDDRLYISDCAHVVSQEHIVRDCARETSLGAKNLGTTKRGIGPCYSDKMARSGARIHMVKDIEKLYPYVHKHAKIIDTFTFLHKSYKDRKKILFEGANATMLDIDHGTYPYVTSSNPTIGGVFTGTGINPALLGQIIGVVKAYTTRVGEGPFPSEDTNKIGEFFQKNGAEYGVTTGRPRRCGWLDLAVIRKSILLNGINLINLTKLDVLTGLEVIKIAIGYKINGQIVEFYPSYIDPSEIIEVMYINMPGWHNNIAQCRRFNELPINAQKYVEKIEELIGIKIGWIGVGKGREDIIHKN